MPPALGSHLQAAKAKARSLGAPTGPEKATKNFAIQQFEHGWMFEPFVDKHIVYVLFDVPKRKTWKRFVENWEEKGGRPDSCPDIREPGGNLRKPDRGFGQVWCGARPDSKWGQRERDAIGWGIHAEFGPTASTPDLYYQEFGRKALMFGGASLDAQYVSDVSGTVIFILKKDGTWDMIGRG